VSNDRPRAEFQGELRGAVVRRATESVAFSMVHRVLRHNEMMNFAAAVSMSLVSMRPSGAARVRRVVAAAGLAAMSSLAAVPAAAQGVYYECPGNVFTNTITAKEANDRGCRARESRQVTTIPGPTKARPAASPTPQAAASKVDAQEQKSRDSDSKKILEDELHKAEAQLDALKQEYNNGEPERQGNEKNYQKYLDRTADLKASIARTESDIAAIKRELGKIQ
jgi:hypothetical protein